MNMKKVLALALATMMVLALVSVAVADENSAHTLTITNTDQKVSHTFGAYQVFVGKADAAGTKLSDVKWGDGVDGDAILTALNADTDTDLAALRTAVSGKTGDAAAAALAEALANFTDTHELTAAAGALDKFAAIVAANIDSAGRVGLTASGTSYSGSVAGDGYYIVLDETTTLTGTAGSDTKSKHILLPVLKNTTAVAKDTGFTPDKEIVEGSARVKEGTAAVGDTITFEVTIPVPNTKKYIDHFCFEMIDTLPVGMTFMSVSSVKVEDDSVAHTVTVAERDSSSATGFGDFATYTAPATAADAVTTAGGQKIKVVFNNFKANAETNNWFGHNLVVTYTAVVNDDANFTSTGNINEVWFDYANDPNHDYDGDEPDTDEPHGETPHSTTKTLLVNIEILKTDGTNALEGAEFEIESTDYNVTLVTGERFVENNTTGTYYKLNDGSYTTTAPDGTNDSVYASTSTKYEKVTFSDENVTPGSTNKVTVISGANGKIVLKGLKPGTYTITETKAPSGYNLDPTPHVIKIVYTGDPKALQLDTTDSDSTAQWTETTATASITIVNKAGTVLPSTGGIGTTIFYVSGLMMVLGAAVILVARRRADAE